MNSATRPCPPMPPRISSMAISEWRLARLPLGPRNCKPAFRTHRSELARVASQRWQTVLFTDTNRAPRAGKPRKCSRFLSIMVRVLLLMAKVGAGWPPTIAMERFGRNIISRNGQGAAPAWPSGCRGGVPEPMRMNVCLGRAAAAAFDSVPRIAGTIRCAKDQCCR